MTAWQSSMHASMRPPAPTRPDLLLLLCLLSLALWVRAPCWRGAARAHPGLILAAWGLQKASGGLYCATLRACGNTARGCDKGCTGKQLLRCSHNPRRAPAACLRPPAPAVHRSHSILPTLPSCSRGCGAVCTGSASRLLVCRAAAVALAHQVLAGIQGSMRQCCGGSTHTQQGQRAIPSVRLCQLARANWCSHDKRETDLSFTHAARCQHGSDSQPASSLRQLPLTRL